MNNMTQTEESRVEKLNQQIRTLQAKVDAGTNTREEFFELSALLDERTSLVNYGTAGNPGYPK